MTAPGDGVITNPWLTGIIARQTDRAFPGTLAAGTIVVQNSVIVLPAMDMQTTASLNRGSEKLTTASLHQNEESQ